jgi:hypothetical protein
MRTIGRKGRRSCHNEQFYGRLNRIYLTFSIKKKIYIFPTFIQILNFLLKKNILHSYANESVISF